MQCCTRAGWYGAACFILFYRAQLLCHPVLLAVVAGHKHFGLQVDKTKLNLKQNNDNSLNNLTRYAAYHVSAGLNMQLLVKIMCCSSVGLHEALPPWLLERWGRLRFRCFSPAGCHETDGYETDGLIPVTFRLVVEYIRDMQNKINAVLPTV